MQILLTDEQLAALRATAEMPDNLTQAVNGAKKDGAGFLVPLTSDEAMAMEEMCEWYILPDPVTGEITPKGKTFQAIAKAIHRAEDA